MAAKHLQKQRARGAGRPFATGVSGNPAGRPAGVRNRASGIAQALLDGEAAALMRKCVELALAGDRVALKLCLERLVPRCPRAVALDLPPVASAADLAPAIAAIAQAVAGGGLTPHDGAELARIFDAYAHAAEFGEFERRLRAVERGIARETGAEAEAETARETAIGDVPTD